MGQLLGSGSFATVLAVQVQNSSGLCALKIYKSRPSLALVTFRQKFENEIHNMRRVSNRHIARFYGAYICERKTQPVCTFSSSMMQSGMHRYVGVSSTANSSNNATTKSLLTLRCALARIWYLDATSCGWWYAGVRDLHLQRIAYELHKATP